MSQTDTIILIFYFHWTKLCIADLLTSYIVFFWLFFLPPFFGLGLPSSSSPSSSYWIQIQLHRWLGYYEGIKLFRNKLTLNFLEGQIILSLKWTYRNNSYTKVFYLSLLLSNLFCKYIFFSFHFYEHVHSICALSCKLTSSSSSNSSSSP